MPEEKLLTFDIPQREGKEGFIGTFFTLYLNMSSILRSPEFIKEPMRVYYLTKLIIASVPGKKNRDEIKKALNERIDSMKKQRLQKSDVPLTEEENNHILIDASLDVLGDVSDFIDKHVGVSRENKLGFVIKK